MSPLKPQCGHFTLTRVTRGVIDRVQCGQAVACAGTRLMQYGQVPILREFGFDNKIIGNAKMKIAAPNNHHAKNE